MADDEVEEQLAQRSRGVRLKKPRQRKDSVDKAGTSKSRQRPLPPPAPSPPKAPVLCDKASQTMPLICRKQCKIPEATASGSTHCLGETPEELTAPDGLSAADGQAASGTSGPTGGQPAQVPTPAAAGRSDPEPGQAPGHPPVETQKKPLDFKRVATGADWSPASSGSQATPQDVRAMLARRAREVSECLDSTSLEDEPGASAGAASGSSGGRRTVEVPIALDIRNYAADWEVVVSPGTAICSPDTCGCFFRLCGDDDDIEAELVVVPRRATAPTPLALLDSPTEPYLNPRRRATRQRYLEEEQEHTQPLKYLYHRSVNTILTCFQAEVHAPPPLSRQLPSPVPPSPRKQMQPSEGKVEHEVDKEPRPEDGAKE